MIPLMQLCLFLSVLVLMINICTYSPTACIQSNFYIKIIIYVCLGDDYKFTANVRDKDHKLSKYVIFVA